MTSIVWNARLPTLISMNGTAIMPSFSAAEAASWTPQPTKNVLRIRPLPMSAPVGTAEASWHVRDKHARADPKPLI